MGWQFATFRLAVILAAGTVRLQGQSGHTTADNAPEREKVA
jgi:hypothetical protein